MRGLPEGMPAKAIVGEKKGAAQGHPGTLRPVQKSCFDTCKFKSINIRPAGFEGDPKGLLELAGKTEGVKK